MSKILKFLASLDGIETASFSKVMAKAPEGFDLPQLKMEVKEVSYFAVSKLESSKEKASLGWNTNFNLGSGSFNPNFLRSPFLSSLILRVCLPLKQSLVYRQGE